MDDDLNAFCSRWRTDQQLLEQGRIREAESDKIRVEDIQRMAARDRQATGVEYQSRFFQPDPSGEYTFNALYWSKRDDPQYWENISKLW